MMRYKLIVAYDGTDFAGWQIQPTDKTVVSVLQKTFQEIFGEKISILGASRTDAGVHALGQVATFTANVNAPVDRIFRAWRDGLPPAILLRSLQMVDDDFHPFKNVVQKTYWYHLSLQRPVPMMARYAWHYGFMHQVDLEKFEQILQCYQGTHDFASFCKLDPGEQKNTVRTIDSIKLERTAIPGIIRIIIKGPGFLRYQIRRMIGYALDIARRPELDAKIITQLLQNPHPQQELIKAEARGLCLRKIVYAHKIL